jgi:peptidyl-prolyl cis-trans isomerase D
MGLAVPDDALRSLVTQDPVFHTGGQFDRSRFDQLLRASGLSEDGYLASLRQQVVRAALTGSITGPVKAPPALVDAIYRYRNEQRRGHYVPVPIESVSDVPAPSE